MIFETKTDLSLSTQREIERISLIPSAQRNSKDAEFIAAWNVLINNEKISVDSDGLILLAAGNVLPQSYSGFKKGALFTKKNATGNGLYINIGDETTAVFGLVDQNATIPNGTPVNAVKATATITSDATAPSDGKKVVIGAITYTYKTTLTTSPATVPYEVLIGASAAESLDNLKLAINEGANKGTKYSTGTIAHPLVTATTNTDTTQVIEAKTAGVSANDIATTTDSAHLSWGATKMAGGIDGTVGIQWSSMVDASYLYICVATNTIAGANWRRIAIGSAY